MLRQLCGRDGQHGTSLSTMRLSPRLEGSSATFQGCKASLAWSTARVRLWSLRAARDRAHERQQDLRWFAELGQTKVIGCATLRPPGRERRAHAAASGREIPNE